MIHRRSFITGLISLVAAPPIVRAGSLMPVKVIGMDFGRGPIMVTIDDLGILVVEDPAHIAICMRLPMVAWRDIVTGERAWQ